ncbi:MerR family transcriptional regulator [Gelria sp. Kuro-4]|uniref:MerR family transcriptional regulator n=1 Tax=Gelria sp. Kuro-4 TaxID=2796927 RepID=UPI001BEF959C|nr:MerR family transcriptional regulator [Gelria sp. Kuro-4]BCV25532.1 hypothetical protein kuro4_23050 [Gelria sp. Kuro-4]
MEVRNCPRCGKMFAYSGFKLCPACRREEENLFAQVESYLRTHPGANLEAVAEGTGIDKEIILDFIRNGRLVTLKAEGLLRCEICGRPIDQGRICRQCAGQLKKGLVQERKPAAPAPAEEGRDHRLHIADLVMGKTGEGYKRRPEKK